VTETVLGIDLAKLNIDVALLIDGKTKNKSFKNTSDGFETLALWLRKLGVGRVKRAWNILATI